MGLAERRQADERRASRMKDEKEERRTSRCPICNAVLHGNDTPGENTPGGNTVYNHLAFHKVIMWMIVGFSLLTMACR